MPQCDDPQCRSEAAGCDCATDRKTQRARIAELKDYSDTMNARMCEAFRERDALVEKLNTHEVALAEYRAWCDCEDISEHPAIAALQKVNKTEAPDNEHP